MAGLAGGGGGANAGAIEAGKAYVSMQVKDETDTGLARVRDQLKQFGKKAKDEFAGGTKLTSLLIGGGAAGAIGGALGSAAIDTLSKAVKGLIPGLESADEQFEKWSKRLAEAGDQMARLRTRFAEMREDLGGGLAAAGVFGLERAALAADLTRLQRELADAKAYQATLREATDASTPGGAGLTGLLAVGSVVGGDTAAALEDAAKKRVELATAEVEKAKELVRLQDRMVAREDPGNKLRQSIFDLSLEAAEASDPAVRGLSAMEKKVYDLEKAYKAAGIALGEAEKLRLADLKEEMKLAEQKIKQMEVEKEFGQELKNAWTANMTRGLSGDDAALAALVNRGFDNDQIMQLRALQQATKEAARQPPGFVSRGGLASASAGLRFGTAAGWKTVEKSIDLNTERLDDIRRQMEVLNDRFGFK